MQVAMLDRGAKGLPPRTPPCPVQVSTKTQELVGFRHRQLPVAHRLSLVCNTGQERLRPKLPVSGSGNLMQCGHCRPNPPQNTAPVSEPVFCDRQFAMCCVTPDKFHQDKGVSRVPPQERWCRHARHRLQTDCSGLMPAQNPGLPKRIGRLKIGTQDKAPAIRDPDLQDTAAMLNTAVDLHPAEHSPIFGQAGFSGRPGPKRPRTALYRVHRGKRIVPGCRRRLF